MNSAPLSGSIRRSQTLEQRQHEESIHQQLSTVSSRLEDVSSGTPEKGVKGKLKQFYKRKVIPAFPEAIQDLSVLGNIHKVEERVTSGIQDTARFPEVARVAQVRHGLDLCEAEVSWANARKSRLKDTFARYLGIEPSDIHVDDIPIVAFGGSGGGYRAMLGVIGYCDEMKRSGLWDLLMYVSGVSGACWSLGAYYTFNHASWDGAIEHCKKRLSPHHPLSADAIRALLSAPGGAESALGPLIQKHKSGLQTVAMDLYSVFTTGYLFLQQDPILQPGGTAKKEVAGYSGWLKWSAAGGYLDRGQEPLPILTAIRHERPWKNWVDPEFPFKEPDHLAEEHAQAEDAWFQWFEITPYEVGCDELEAWVPTWGFGRPFREGRSVMQLPEQSLSLLLGLCTSAPAGPLSSYISTISRNLPTGFIGDQIHSLAGSVTDFWGKRGTDEFTNHHPLHACNEHNYLFHLTPLGPGERRPDGIENSPRIHLIDSGMDNNCPTYVLLHPEREVDVIINMDASSDVQKDTFQQRAEQIGFRKGLAFKKRYAMSPGPETDPDRFNGLYAQVYDGTLLESLPEKVVDSYGNEVTNPPAPLCRKEVTMIYMPLLPNERAVKDFDPSTAKFSGSYNLVWTPEQVDMLLKVCRANFLQGQDVIKETLHEVWMKKREARLKREAAFGN